MFACVVRILGLGAIANGDIVTGVYSIPLYLMLTYYSDELNARISHRR